MIAEYNQELKVELVEKEIFGIELKTIDIIDNTRQFTESLEAHIVTNETPTPTLVLPSKRFVIANSCKTSTLQVYFNGIFESNITIHSNTEFSFGINIIASDDIRVNYVKD